MLFDSHCHLHDRKFDGDRGDAVARAREAGVGAILTLGDTIAASRAALALAREVPEVHAAAGIHPSAAASWCDETEADLRALLAEPEVVVLGEIGLDHYWDTRPETLARQEKAFRAQLRLADELGLAVSIHSRESNADVLRVLEEEDGSAAGGVLHSFVGSWDEARRGLEMGFFLGVGGIATFPKSSDLREVLRQAGLDRLLIETDAPYLAPQPRRGRRNEPAHVRHVAEMLAELFDTTIDAVADATTANAVRAFRLDPIPSRTPPP